MNTLIGFRAQIPSCLTSVDGKDRWTGAAHLLLEMTGFELWNMILASDLPFLLLKWVVGVRKVGMILSETSVM